MKTIIHEDAEPFSAFYLNHLFVQLASQGEFQNSDSVLLIVDPCQYVRIADSIFSRVTTDPTGKLRACIAIGAYNIFFDFNAPVA